jgi:hypothetical protein
MTLPGSVKKRGTAPYMRFAALDYAGFSKPNDLLERLAKELLSSEPKKPIKFGT